jgi:hypothetical protein
MHAPNGTGSSSHRSILGLSLVRRAPHAEQCGKIGLCRRLRLGGVWTYGVIAMAALSSYYPLLARRAHEQT